MREAESTLAYDGSLPGFLCACAEALNAPEPAPRPVRSREPEGLFETRFSVRRDDARAEALWDRLTRRAGPVAMRTFLEAFLSDAPRADATTARAMRRAWREGPGALRDLSDGVMLALDKAALRARREANLLCGLARFSELSDGSWYAPVEPACDALPLIADHFAARFPGMRFAVHDRVRGSAVLHEAGGGWTLVDGFGLEGTGMPPLSESERAIRRLWKLYFETIAIASRLNPRLQSSRMPKKYWGLLTELGGLE